MMEVAWNQVYAFDGDHGNVCSRYDSRVVGVLRTAGRSSYEHRGAQRSERRWWWGSRDGRRGKPRTVRSRCQCQSRSCTSTLPNWVSTRSFWHVYVFLRSYVLMYVCMCVCVHDPVCRTRPRCKHFLLWPRLVDRNVGDEQS